MSEITLGTHILKIDRATPFEQLDIPGTCLNSSSRTPSITWQDDRSLTLTEIDIDAIQLVSMLRTGEYGINGRERIRRIKENGYIMLDLRIFSVICRNRPMAERLLRRVRTREPKPDKLEYEYWQHTPCVCFDGTIFDVDHYPQSTAAFGPAIGVMMHTQIYPADWGPWGREAASAVLIPE